ncbi:endonuclease/exonuclease/phosphatase family metal-dependent hydrolase [Dyadobacter sp. BE34]|uniref:Endonuclease/exonuclease/phosphatase family metal-dependent hydrolase n=1 Tax=Dyadobacter fermentans TaxID=94254 RepID=A0ABU1R214_9BACT|nr:MULTISPECIES: endonuclease/exonuclease/phosphatase family protein [Dyadobacter]MDR6807446.1 endonuclease/exonuclease/phosphatase family metal-dependent hydrolase [Dyadobacter fermentans]MDR7045187.1 endonuclease/exonuclease/phosphatase family metal-dependent hydrolase [Dyadobacter sp. BE242]MDR7199076.1 endonuclease/exonuclease/phosphatase family metal-dependent hydrolase [Dyadobacter sp. BE34]MDR7217036.1 endonuclease/exonuclease/phosphatase family metal-dependent hydrolase [Dyadobacter sp.
MKKIALYLLAFVSLASASYAQKTATINVASYNLRYNTPNDGVNAWPNRKENVKGLIRFHEFDIFGVQEALVGQLKDVAELPEFAYYGKGRDDGKEGGEHSAIFYKKDRFKLLKSGDFWLSETPDKPGLGWDAKCCNRICSWAQFEDMNTKKKFYFFNVHFDHQGVEARRQSGHLMVKKIKEIAGNSTAILTGDFNSSPDTEQIKTIAGVLNDTHDVTKQAPYGPEGTFNSFKFDAEMKTRIDYIFVSKNVDVLKYGVLTDSKEQRYPSDHQPVLVKVEIK